MERFVVNEAVVVKQCHSLLATFPTMIIILMAFRMRVAEKALGGKQKTCRLRKELHFVSEGIGVAPDWEVKGILRGHGDDD